MSKLPAHRPSPCTSDIGGAGEVCKWRVPMATAPSLQKLIGRSHNCAATRRRIHNRALATLDPAASRYVRSLAHNLAHILGHSSPAGSCRSHLHQKAEAPSCSAGAAGAAALSEEPDPSHSCSAGTAGPEDRHCTQTKAQGSPVDWAAGPGNRPERALRRCPANWEPSPDMCCLEGQGWLCRQVCMPHIVGARESS
jgi:hypothetical protein